MSKNSSYALAGILFLLASTTLDRAAAAFYVEGDSIGSDSTATDNTGGFTAVLQNSENLGQPAIQVPLTGQELLTDLRAIVFGLPGTGSNLFFQDFDYRLDIWRSTDYFAGAAPEFQVELGEPVDISLAAVNPMTVIPNTPFGTAGALAGNADTFDFRFDLTNLPASGMDQDIFSSPFPPGEWVLGLQSWHNTDSSGVLRVAASSATEGPLPLFSRGDSIPRGVLGGQDPENIALRWGISLAASIPGDFNDDLEVNAGDLALWESAFGLDNMADADLDGDSDGADFLIWQRNSGIEVNSLLSQPVPELPTAFLTIAAFLWLSLQRVRLR